MSTKSSLFNDTPYLPFAIHESQRDIGLEISKKDIEVLRELGKAYADIASLPVQAENIKLWKDVNDLKNGRPAVWMNEVCWHEMNVDGELTLRCESEIGRRIEIDLRKTIYQWKHMPCNMVVDTAYYAPVILTNSGFGLQIDAQVLETDAENTIASRHFQDLIREEADIDRLKFPEIACDVKRTRDFYECYSMIFDGIMPVETRGCTGFWFAPWDDIAMLKGADDLLMDLAMKPEMMHKLISRMVDCYMDALRQFREYNVLARNDINVRVGSGGYGYVEELPGENFDPGHVTTMNMWGSATPQIFAAVSPEMHEEFGIAYEKRWLKQFKLAYYGCCEPLDGKIAELSTIENLRKISISPWANVERAAENMRGRYAVSLKPSPSYFVGAAFDREGMRADLTGKLKALKGCSVEIILKDISTVSYRPQDLWEWAEIAKDIINSIY